MAKKLSEYSREDKGRISRELDTASGILLGIESWEGGGRLEITDDFGLCGTCKYFQYARSEFKVKTAKCYELDLFLSSEDVVTECTKYNKVGSMTLSMMEEIAYIIENRNPIGFKVEEEKEDGD